MDKFIENFNFYIIKYLLKIGKIKNRNKLCTKDGICRIEDIKNNLNCKKISIQLYKNDDKNKLFRVLPILIDSGKEIEIIEFDKVLEDEYIRKLRQISPDIAVNFRYMIDSYYSVNNIKTVYDVESYIEIIDKTEYLAKIAKTNFRRTRRANNVYC